MIGLGSLSAFEDVQALIKGKVGEFLQAEQALRRLTAHPSVSVRAQANALLAEHTVLEGELGTAQSKIAQFQTGAWSLSDVISLGDVGTRLIQHLGKVTSLERSASGVTSPLSVMSGSMVPVLGAVAAAAVLWFAMRR